MRISCDHCGAVFDSSKNEVCPRCGAAYGDSRKVKSIEDYEQKKREYDLEQEKAKLESQRQRNELFKEQIENERRRNENRRRAEDFSNRMNKGCTGAFLAIGLVFLFLIAVGVKIGLDEAKGNVSKRTSIVSEETTTMIPIEKAEGNYGEEIDTGRYAFKIDKIEETSYYPWSGKKDHTCLLIHMTLTSHMDRDYNSDIYQHVLADGIAQEFFYLPQGYKKLPSWLPKGTTIEGWAKVEIPNDAKDVQFRFGDYVTCHFTWDDITK